MKVVLDDTGRYVTTDEKEFRVKDFDASVRELLTKKQYDIYIGTDTRRTFVVSAKKWEAFLQTLNTNDL